MPSCTFVTEVEGGRTVIRVLGVFDRTSAQSLRDRIGQERGQDVVLDFSLVREFDDLGIATLAGSVPALAGSGRLAFRGLRQHQLRLFRYFGVDAEAADGAAHALAGSGATATRG